MDKTNSKWVLECCLLSLDNMTKEEMIKLGAPEVLAAAGIKLGIYLSNKEFNV